MKQLHYLKSQNLLHPEIRGMSNINNSKPDVQKALFSGRGLFLVLTKLQNIL